MHDDELRRNARAGVCCRVDVRDKFGIWTAVTEDVSSRGCRLVTTKAPRVGSRLELALSSDLIPEVLEVTGYAAWVSDHRVGVVFAKATQKRGITPRRWTELLVQHAKVLGPEPVGSTGARLAPSFRRPPQPARSLRVLPKPDPDGRAENAALALPRRNG